MDTSQKSEKTHSLPLVLAAVIMIASLAVGGLAGYFVGYFTFSPRISGLQNDVASLQKNASGLENQISALQKNITDLESAQNITDQINVLQNDLAKLLENESELQNELSTLQKSVSELAAQNNSFSTLYDRVKNSVVVIRGAVLEYDIFGQPYYAEIQGSGFVYNSTGREVIVTNDHVVENTLNISATFIDGNGYAADVLGTDSYADLAVLSINVAQGAYRPLELANSSTVKVGDPVIAVGSPYGLTGSITAGIVSAMGRTITEGTGTGISIADCIQTSTPINPGNSGGPLLNDQGEVVGITTAVVGNSQGLGFAIPSNTIMREIDSLIDNGSYDQHPLVGVIGVDMSVDIAEAMNTNTTYGLLITQVLPSGPADSAGLRAGNQTAQILGLEVTIGGDIIVAINGTRITGTDDFFAFLEERTLPNQTISVTIVRNNQTMTLPLILGTRPAP